MPYWDNGDGKGHEGFDNRRRDYEQQLEEHQQSSECTQKEDCPICKRLNTEIYLCNPNLP